MLSSDLEAYTYMVITGVVSIATILGITNSKTSSILDHPLLGSALCVLIPLILLRAVTHVYPHITYCGDYYRASLIYGIVTVLINWGIWMYRWYYHDEIIELTDLISPDDHDQSNL